MKKPEYTTEMNEEQGGNRNRRGRTSRFSRRGFMATGALGLGLAGTGLSTSALGDEHEDTISADLGEDPEFDGLDVEFDNDGWEAATREGESGWRTNQSANADRLLCVADDGFGSGERIDVEVTIRYYDEGEAGYDLTYERSDDGEVTTQHIEMVGDQQWKAQTFVLQDVLFDGGIVGTDFRIGTWDDDVVFSEITVRELAEYERTSASATLGTDTRFDGLVVKSGGGGGHDGVHTATENCWETNVDEAAYYIFVDVDDSFMYEPEGSVLVTVQYLDEGTGKFGISYDGPDGRYTGAGDVVYLEDTGELREHTFLLTDPVFANRQSFGNDLRIGTWSSDMDSGGDEDVCFAGVSVEPSTLVDTISADLSENPEFDGLTVAFDNEGWDVVTRDGEAGWITDQSENARRLFCDADDWFGSGDRIDVEVTIRYYDDGEGAFPLRYEHVDGEYRSTTHIQMVDDHQWKEQTFVLRDVPFNGSIGGNDLQITTWDDDIVFSEITVRELTEYERTSVDADLGANTRFDGLVAKSGGGGSYGGVHTTRDGCWETNVDDEAHFVFVDIDDSFMYEPDSNALVTVRYRDEGTGKFGISYDGPDGRWTGAGDVVHLEDTGEIREHTFLLIDPVFANRQSFDNDMRIGTWSSDMDSGGDEDVCFAGVSVEPTDAETLGLRVEARNPGNLFFTDGPLSFQVYTAGDTVSWTIQDYEDEVVVDESVDVDEELEVPVPDRKGYYEIDISSAEGDEEIEAETLAFAVIDNYDFSDDRDTFFGLTGDMMPWTGDYPVLADQVGAGTRREGITWQWLEEEVGVYELYPVDEEELRGVRDLGMSHIATLAYGNELHIEPWVDDKTAPMNDEQREAFADYAEAVATSVGYPDNIDGFGIWNEWNVPHFSTGPAGTDPQEYVNLLEVVSSRLKEVRPETPVYGINNSWRDIEFLEETMELGALDYLDAVSINPYRRSWSPSDDEAQYGIGDFEEEMVWVKDKIAEYNDGETLPVYITEFGYITDGDPRAISESTQAHYLVQSHVMAKAAGVERFCWYQFADNPNHTMGLVRDEEASKGAYTPRPSYVSYAVMTRQLAGSEFVDHDDVTAANVDEPMPNVYSYEFDTNDGPLHVFWSESETTAELSANTDLELVDTMGVEHTAQLANGVVETAISSSPTYAYGDVDGLEVIVPSEWLADVSYGALQFAEASLDEVRVPVTIESTAENTSLEITGIEWTIDEETSTMDLDRTVDPGQSATVELPITGIEYWTSLPLSVSVEFAALDSLGHEGEVSLNPLIEYNQTVDGDLSELADLGHLSLPGDGTIRIEPYHGEADNSADVWLTWDAENFYLAAAVEDDVHYQPETGGSTWQADSVQFGIAAGQPGDTDRFQEFTLALTEQGPQVFKRVQNGDGPAGLVDEADVAASRDGTTTTYQVALPWSLLDADLSEGVFSFSALINENDGSGRRGWLEWGAGIGSTKNTTLFEQMQILDTESPEIAIEGVAHDGTYEGSVAPEVAVTDNSRGAEVTTTLNGEPWDGETIAEPGVYTLHVAATDPFGNATTETVEFIVYEPIGTMRTNGWIDIRDEDRELVGDRPNKLHVKARWTYENGAADGELRLHAEPHGLDVSVDDGDADWLVVDEGAAAVQAPVELDGETYTLRVRATESIQHGRADSQVSITLWGGDTRDEPAYDLAERSMTGRVDVNRSTDDQ